MQLRFVALALGCVTFLPAQTRDTAAIFGLVADQQGAAVTSATVMITSTATNQARTVQTNDSGQYLFSSLPIGGYSLAVVDTRRMTVVSRYSAPGETFFVGIVAMPDPATPGGTLVLASGGASNIVYAFDLDPLGRLTPDAKHAIAIPTPADPHFADAGRAFPSTLVLDRRGNLAYVINNLSDDVATIDPASRSVVGRPVPVGFFPLAAAMSSAGLLVANEGLMRYGTLASPTATPPFAATRGCALTTFWSATRSNLG